MLSSTEWIYVWNGTELGGAGGRSGLGLRVREGNKANTQHGRLLAWDPVPLGVERPARAARCRLARQVPSRGAFFCDYCRRRGCACCGLPWGGWGRSLTRPAGCDVM